MRQSGSQVPEVLTDRGLGWQATGFTLTGVICLAILKSYDSIDFWLYQWFETAVVDLYWSFVLPLAVLFDGGRRLFEKGKAIREAQKARMVERARRKGEKDERERIQKELERRGVVLSPEVVEAVFSEDPNNGT